MKTSIALLAMFLLPSFYSFSQKVSDDITIEWGEKYQYKKHKSTYPIYIPLYDDSGMFICEQTIKKGSRIPTLTHYNNQLKLVQSKVLATPKELRNTFMRAIFVLPMKNKLFGIQFRTDFKQKKEQLLIQEIDKNSMTLSKERKVTDEKEMNDKIKNGPFDDFLPSYQFINTNEKSEISYLRILDSGFVYHTLDTNLNLINKSEFHHKNTLQLYGTFGNNSMFVKQNKLLILSGIFNGQVKINDEFVTKYDYNLLIFDLKTKEKNNLKISLTGKLITSTNLNVEGNKIIVSSFYSEKNGSSAVGANIKVIDINTKRIILEKTEEFGNDLITQYLSQKEKDNLFSGTKKGEKIEIENLELQETIFRKDGGMFLIGQTNLITTLNGKTYTTSKEIIVLNFSSNGDILWKKKFPVKISEYPGLESNGGYFTFLQGNKLNIMFNDNIKNFDSTKKTMDDFEYFKRNKNFVVSRLIIDANGNSVKEVLYSYKDAQVFLCPKVCKKTGKNEITFLAANRKFFHQLGKITFKEPIEIQ